MKKINKTDKTMVALFFLALFMLFSTIANAQKVDICHIPPGDPDNAHTISINSNAVDAHLAHGDYLGPCNDSVAHVELLKVEVSPNPYLEQINIRYTIQEASDVRMEVYNLMGNKIRTLMNERKEAGKYSQTLSKESLGEPVSIKLLNVTAVSDKRQETISTLLIESR